MSEQPKEFKLTKRNPPQPLILIPSKDGEYDDDADIREMSDKIQEFLYGVSKGYSTHHACALAGCKLEAMMRWLTPKNKNYKPKLHTLFRRARAIFYAKQVDKIANTPDWRAAALWLERHEPDWNPKEAASVNVIGMDGLASIKMDSETLNALSAAYDERFKVDKSKAKVEVEESNDNEIHP